MKGQQQMGTRQQVHAQIGNPCSIGSPCSVRVCALPRVLCLTGIRIVAVVLCLLVVLSVQSGIAHSDQPALPSSQPSVPSLSDLSPSHLNVSARGADVRELLHALALQYRVNIVMDTEVTGPVTI